MGPLCTPKYQQGLRVAGTAEAVLHADTLDRDRAVRAYDLSDCAAKTAEDVVFLCRDDRAGLLRRLPDRFAVDRLDRMHIDHTRVDAFLSSSSAAASASATTMPVAMIVRSVPRGV